MRVKTVIKVIIEIFVGGYLLLQVGNYWFNHSQFKQTLFTKITQNLPVKVTVNENWSVRIFPQLGLKLKQVQLTAADYQLDVASINIKLKILPLLAKRFEFTKIYIEQPNLQIIQKETIQAASNNRQTISEVDLSRQLQQLKSVANLVERLQLNIVELHNGNINWQLDGTSKRQIKALQVKIINSAKATFDVQLSGLIADNKFALAAQLRIDEADGLTLTDGKITAAGGACYFNGMIKPQKAKIWGECAYRLVQLKVHDLLSLFGLNLPITGELNGTISLSSLGVTSSELMKQLAGQGELTITHGAYLGMDLLYELKRVKAILQFTALPERRSSAGTPFDQIGIGFKVQNGELHSNQLWVKADEYQVAGAGKMIFSDNAMDFDLTAWLKELKDITIPIKISGKITAPTVNLDTRTILKKSVKALGDNINDVVVKSFNKFLRKK